MRNTAGTHVDLDVEVLEVKRMLPDFNARESKENPDWRWW